MSDSPGDIMMEILTAPMPLSQRELDHLYEQKVKMQRAALIGYLADLTAEAVDPMNSSPIAQMKWGSNSVQVTAHDDSVSGVKLIWKLNGVVVEYETMLAALSTAIRDPGRYIGETYIRKACDSSTGQDYSLYIHGASRFIASNMTFGHASFLQEQLKRCKESDADLLAVCTEVMRSFAYKEGEGPAYYEKARNALKKRGIKV